MEYSDYLGLKLPDGSETGDFYNIEDFIENFESLDDEAKRMADGNVRQATGNKLSNLVMPGEYTIANALLYEDAPTQAPANVECRLQVSAIGGRVYQELTLDHLHYSRLVKGDTASAWYCPELNIEDLQTKMAVVKSYVDTAPLNVQSRIGYLRADNQLKNSLLTYQSDWAAIGQHTIYIADGKLDFGSPYAGYLVAVRGNLQSTADADDLIYVSTIIRSTQPISSAHFAQSTSGVAVPANTDKRISAVYSTAVSTDDIQVVAEFASPAVAYESATSMTKPIAINLTKAFGKGFEPSLAEIENWILRYQAGFYSGKPSFLLPSDTLFDMITATNTQVSANATNIGLFQSIALWMTAEDSGNPLNAIARNYGSFSMQRSLCIVVNGGQYGASVFAMGLKSSETYGAFIVFGYFDSPKFFRKIDGVWSESDL